jgi:4-amino-4-deoxy-L-arabinose transferase-like glycosyltransferase
VVIPLTVVLSVPSLVWFGHHWTVIGNDAGRYLLAGSQLISGEGREALAGISHINHGPGFPVLLGSLILLFGRDTEDLVWAVRLLAHANPLLAYLLVKRISSPVAGLIAAALVTLFGYNVKPTLNIDAVLLTFYLVALLTLLAAIKRNSSLLALLSGFLLGFSILTKETAFVNLPLALLAVLLLDWNLRGALWHYLGVVLVCLSWWIWAYSATGEVYLVDRLPVALQVPILIVTVILLSLTAVAYALGIVARFLTDEHRRRWTGWFVVLAWTVSLSGLLLATAALALARLSLEDLRLYLANLLAPSILVLPVLGLVSGYVIWKAGRQNAPWRLLALALLFQVPVCLLVMVERWAPRQFLIPQTLLFCALAALAVAALKAAIDKAALRGNAYSSRLAGAGAAASLVVLLLVPSVERVRALLSENPNGSFEQHMVTPRVNEMIDWMDENVPAGEHILVTRTLSNDSPPLGKYLVFLDGGQHEWTFMRLDQNICRPQPNIRIRCNPDRTDISRIPPDAVWVQMVGECKAISLSMSNLLGQVRRTGSDYVMISGSSPYPGILKLPSHLEGSGAFEVVHSELDPKGGSSAKQGVVLLKGTGRTPKAVPTQMNAHSVFDLRRCEQVKVPGYTNWIKSNFPNGILRTSD